jgi:hypothetical protein
MTRIAALVWVAGSVHAWPWSDNLQDDPASRAEMVLAEMSTDEKLIMLHGSPSTCMKPKLDNAINRCYFINMMLFNIPFFRHGLRSGQ